VFTVTPQPNGRRATSKHDNMANSFAERRSSLGIEPRLEAQSELSTSFTCIVRALQRGKRIVASTTLETSETTALSIRRYSLCRDATLVCLRPTLFKYKGHSYQGLLPHDRNLSMTPIGHRAWETLLEAQRAHGTNCSTGCDECCPEQTKLLLTARMASAEGMGVIDFRMPG
jgi:hypothetical protein